MGGTFWVFSIVVIIYLVHIVIEEVEGSCFSACISITIFSSNLLTLLLVSVCSIRRALRFFGNWRFKRTSAAFFLLFLPFLGILDDSPKSSSSNPFSFPTKLHFQLYSISAFVKILSRHNNVEVPLVSRPSQDVMVSQIDLVHCIFLNVYLISVHVIMVTTGINLFASCFWIVRKMEWTIVLKLVVADAVVKRNFSSLEGSLPFLAQHFTLALYWHNSILRL